MKLYWKTFTGLISALLLILAVISGCNQVSSKENDTFVPTATPTLTSLPDAIEPAPVVTPSIAPVAVEMDLARLTAEFEADPAAALENFAGQRFIFRNVYADDVSTVYKPFNWDQFVMNGRVKFRPEYPSYISELKVHSVMDIEGTVQFLQGPFLIISDCRYTVTDTSNALDRPDFQTIFA